MRTHTSSRPIRAEIGHDEATIRRILDERFLFVGGTEAPGGTDDFVAMIMQGYMSTEEMSDRHILVDGDTAVVVELDTRGSRSITISTIFPNNHCFRLSESLAVRRWLLTKEQSRVLMPGYKRGRPSTSGCAWAIALRDSVPVYRGIDVDVYRPVIWS